MKYDEKINEKYFSYNNMKVLNNDHFFLTLRSHSSVHVQNKTFVSFFSLFLILIVFMGDITPKIFLSMSI